MKRNITPQRLNALFLILAKATNQEPKAVNTFLGVAYNV